jgi:hypothetical protein
MRLHDSRQYKVNGIDCLIWDKGLFYGFLGRLRDKEAGRDLCSYLGQFILDLQVIFYYLAPGGEACHY